MFKPSIFAHHGNRMEAAGGAPQLSDGLVNGRCHKIENEDPWCLKGNQKKIPKHICGAGHPYPNLRSGAVQTGFANRARKAARAPKAVF